MTAATDIQIANDCDSGHSLQRMVGRSLPSQKYGAWIVAEVRGNIEGRSRLVTANLKGEQWVWTRSLVAMFTEHDAPNEKAQPRPDGRTQNL